MSSVSLVYLLSHWASKGSSAASAGKPRIIDKPNSEVQLDSSSQQREEERYPMIIMYLLLFTGHHHQLVFHSRVYQISDRWWWVQKLVNRIKQEGAWDSVDTSLLSGQPTASIFLLYAAEFWKWEVTVPTNKRRNSWESEVVGIFDI